MRDSSYAVASSLIAAVQRDIGVWLRRAVSAVAWSRCHLVCHWLRNLLPSKYGLVDNAEARAQQDYSATIGDPGIGTGIGERLPPVPVKVRHLGRIADDRLMEALDPMS